MRLVYSVGYSRSSAISLSRFLDYNQFEIRIASYDSNSHVLPSIHWTLDRASRKGFGVNHDRETITADLKDFKPNLIITDGEPILIALAKELEIPFWCISPLFITKALTEKLKLNKNALTAPLTVNNLVIPKTTKKLIYSPFYFIKPEIFEPGFEWILPYYKEPDPNAVPAENVGLFSAERSEILKPIVKKAELQYDWNNTNYWTAESCFMNGETSCITDVLANRVQKLIISPDLEDPEAVLNARICERHLKIAHNVGQIEYMDKFASDYLNQANKLAPDISNLKYEFPKSGFLHEKVEEYARSL